MINIACGSMVARRGKGVWRCDEPAMVVLKFQGKDKQIHEVHRCNQHGEALKRELQMNDLRTRCLEDLLDAGEFAIGFGQIGARMIVERPPFGIEPGVALERH